MLKLFWRVIASDLFGQYADRRLIVAALDPVKPEELVEHAQQFMPGHDNEEVWTFTPDQDGAVWIDWVADLENGFDPTYAIASVSSKTLWCFLTRFGCKASWLSKVSFQIR
ncbi:hypothetical protein ABIB94_007919 [Bradyrhizobium sp. JR7.2]|uniref:hypothetical protein n=1 Tax=unclassified Bradyrhizobium TaxID=2631580 RepID=UPI0033978C65